MKNMIREKKIGALVLAAGKGTRMYSTTPKVLQELLGLPLLWYVYENTRQVVNSGIWTVVGYGREQIVSRFPDQQFLVQEKQLGTGHALQGAWETLRAAGLDYVLVCNGDTPLVSPDTLRSFINQALATEQELAFLSLQLENPGSYGRVIRNQAGQITGIVEARDFDPQRYKGQKNEVNSGIYLLHCEKTGPLLARLDNHNAQQEYYITQLVELALQAQLQVQAVYAGNSAELMGINTARELIEAEEFLRNTLVQRFIEAGVRIRNHSQVRISPQTRIAPGVDICGPCEIYGSSNIEAGTVIASHCVLNNVHLGACQIRPFSHIDEAEIGTKSIIGPFSRIRPGTCLEDDVRVGNFVEIKNSRLRSRAKAGHLTYLGDSEIGTDVNIGAGTITCNYDGQKKHKTTIANGAFIGSNTALVAPVEVGEQAIIGAGTVVTQKVPEKHLCIARVRQTNLPHRKKKQDK